MRNTAVVMAIVLIIAAAAATYFLLQPPKPNDFPPRPENAKAVEPKQAAPKLAASVPESDPPIPEGERMPQIVEEHSTTRHFKDGEEVGSRPIKVYGTVTDAATGAPIPGALLYTDAYELMTRSLDDPDSMYNKEVAASQVTGEELRNLVALGKSLPLSAQKNFETPTVTSDENGAYSLTVDSSIDQDIHCRAKGFAVASHETNEQSPENLRVDFQLRKGATISGTVTNAAKGVPVEDVKVRAIAGEARQVPWETFDSNSLDATTNADGTYTLEGVPAGHHVLIVEGKKEGWLFDRKRSINLTVADNEQKTGVDLVVTEGLRAEGTVKDEDGHPVEGARISSSLKSNEMFDMISELVDSESIKSDSDGHFIAIGLRPGTNKISAMHLDYADASAEVSVAEGQTPPHVDIVMVKGATVSGVAKFDDGSPAVYQALHLTKAARENVRAFDIDFSGRNTEFTDDTSGEFEFKHVTPGDYILSTEPMVMPDDEDADDGAPRVPVHVDKDPVSGIEITIAKNNARLRGGVITGNVLDQVGNPAPGVGMRAESKEDMEFAFGKNGEPDTNTEKDGTFTIDHLSGDLFTVYAESDKGEASQANVKPGDKITLRLGPLTAVSGIVVDASGDAVPGCKVELTKPKSDAAETMESMMSRMMESFMPGGGTGETTDDFGQFTFKHVEAGDYIVEAKSAGKGFGASEKFAVAKGAEKDDVRVVLNEGATFTGVVADGSGTPVHGANVSLLESTGSPMEGLMTNLPMGIGPAPAAVATSGADGAFTLTGVKPGKYLLTAKHADFAPFSAKDVDVAASQSSPYKITLSKGGSASGQYLAADGKPKANVMIQLMGQGGMQMATTDSEGRFEVKGLPAGTYMVNVVDIEKLQQSGHDDEMPDMGFKSVTITEGGDIVIPFGGGVAVTGTVPAEHLGKMTMVYLMRKGAPDMPSMSMFGGMDPMGLMDTGMQMVQYTAGLAEVKEDGTFKLSAVDPGEYELRVYASDMNMDEIDPGQFMNMSFEEMQQQSQTFAPKEVYKQPVTVGAQPLTVEFAAPKPESP